MFDSMNIHVLESTTFDAFKLKKHLTSIPDLVSAFKLVTTAEIPTQRYVWLIPKKRRAHENSMLILV